VRQLVFAGEELWKGVCVEQDAGVNHSNIGHAVSIHHLNVFSIHRSTFQMIQWLINALLLNVAVDAMHPDRLKFSSKELLVNPSIVLLKLCEPFINDVKNATLVDPGFVCSPKSRGRSMS
jgi:hypothetical protein